MSTARSPDLQTVYIDHFNDCQISLQRNWLKKSEADALYQELSKLPWREEKVVLFGKRHTLVRKTYSMALSNVGPYPYAGKLEIPEPFSENVENIRQRLEADLGVRFNFVLMNYYPDGDASMGWHSDSENSIVEGSTIASLSLGATRRFDVRKRDATSGCAYKVDLGHGTLLLMEGKTQQHYKHQVPKQKSVKLPRINLTFRLMKGDAKNTTKL